jgi:GTP cyclohydrolase I
VIVETHELVVVRGMRFSSRCEAHELPYHGVVHVGYLPSARMLDGADLADAIEECATGSQRQERLTAAISDWLAATLEPLGSAVVLEAEHACHAELTAGGRGGNVVTARFRGVLRSDAPLRAEFVARCVRR